MNNFISELIKQFNPVQTLFILLIGYIVISKQIKALKTELETKMDKNHAEIKQDMKELETKIDKNHTEAKHELKTLNNRIYTIYRDLFKKNIKYSKVKDKDSDAT